MSKSFSDARRMSELIIRSKLQEGRKLSVWELEYLRSHVLSTRPGDQAPLLRRGT